MPFYLLLFGVLTIGGIFLKDFGTKQYSAGEVAGASTNLELFIQPATGRQPILEAINSAEQEILVEVYLLSDKEIINRLIEAKNRGVAVRVMIEEHPFGGGNVNRVSFEKLRDAGVEFKWTNPTFALTHEKAIIIDRQTLFILNQNLTTTAFSRNREYNVIDRNPEHVSEAVGIFEADWNRVSYSPSSTSLVVSPENARGKITALLNLAVRTIEMELEIVQDRDMINLLAESGKRIAVRIIMPDFRKVPSNMDAAEKLKAAGVSVRTLSSPYVHAKLVLVDKTRAYVGSVNFSDASLDQNRELGILISQPDIVDRLDRTFEEDWGRAQEF